MKIETTVKNGKVSELARNLILKALQELEGKIAVIEIKLLRNTRSNRQNRYMSVVYQLAGKAFEDAHGGVWSRTRTKYELKIAVGHCEEYMSLDGTTRKEELPTPKMDTAEFTILINKMRGICYEFMGVDIPDPDGQPYSYNMR